MGIENLDEYKKRKAFRKKREAKYLNRKSEWLLAVYNPKNFRRNTKSAIPKENKSTEMKSHRLRVIKIKLIELMKKPKMIKVFSANCDKVVN